MLHMPFEPAVPTAKRQSRRLRRGALSAVAGVATGLLAPAAAPAPMAAAGWCPDVEVIFARGTFEPEGVGATGQAFVDALRTRLGGTSLEVYPVNYPASLDFPRAADGVADTRNKVMALVSDCPQTRIVLGGYSQGAAVAAYTTTDTVPAGFTLPDGISGPMPASVADHVAAVALFGKPSGGFLNMINRDAPPITIGGLYTAKTVDLCVPEDPVCSPGGNDQSAHGAHISHGMTDQAANFAAPAITAHQ